MYGFYTLHVHSFMLTQEEKERIKRQTMGSLPYIKIKVKLSSIYRIEGNLVSETLVTSLNFKVKNQPTLDMRT